jgi:hypothetical protein
VHTSWHAVARYCMTIACGYGTWTSEECDNYWSPPEPG